MEYENWTEEPIPEAVLQNYVKAVQQLRKYKPYEEDLVSGFPQSPWARGAFLPQVTVAGLPLRCSLPKDSDWELASSLEARQGRRNKIASKSVSNSLCLNGILFQNFLGLSPPPPFGGVLC